MIDFSRIVLENYIGQAFGQPAQICRRDAVTAQIPIAGVLYQVGDTKPDVGIQVDLGGLAPALQVNPIRSVYIDNLENATPCYVYFPDTGFTAPCLPYSVAWVPVLTNQLKANVYITGITDTTIPNVNIFFNNFSVPMAWQAIPQSSTVTPVSITYVGSVFNSTSGSTHTFNATPIGTAGTGRKLLLGVIYNANSAVSTNAILSSLTVGGNASTLLSNAASGFNSNVSASLFALDTGTTANIVCNFNQSIRSCCLVVWNMYDNVSNAPYSVKTQLAGGIGSASSIAVSSNIVLNTRSGMIALSCAQKSVDSGSAICALSSLSNVLLDKNQTLTGVSGVASAGGAGHYNSNPAIDPFNNIATYSINPTPGNNRAKIIQLAWEP